MLVIVRRVTEKETGHVRSAANERTRGAAVLTLI